MRSIPAEVLAQHDQQAALRAQAAPRPARPARHTRHVAGGGGGSQAGAKPPLSPLCPSPPPPLRMPPPRSPTHMHGSTPLHVGFVEAGELFGEIGVLKMRSRSASVVALQPCEAFVVTRYASPSS